MSHEDEVWTTGNSRQLLMDVAEKSDHLEVEYVSQRTGNTKSIEGDVITIRENDTLWQEDVTSIVLDREDGKEHILAMKHGQDEVKVFSRKDERLSMLGSATTVIEKVPAK